MTPGFASSSAEAEKIAQSLRRAGITAPPPGGAILFFSGGSALKDVAAALAALGLNSTHIISTFDSGGSSGALRRAFGIPAIGDLRRRLSSLSGCLYLERRLQGGEAELAELAAQVPPEQGKLLADLRGLLPPDFCLEGASLGNLLMVSWYLQNGRGLYATVRHFAAELGARGLVLPVSEEAAHLAVRLESGAVLTGQHRFTGKELPGPPSPIGKMFFCRCLDDARPVAVRPGPDVLAQIAAAGLICYPVGSFYSSVLANLQVQGVGRAITRSTARKLYLPNPGPDPESAHLSLEEQLEAICLAAAGRAEASGVVDFLLVDRQNAVYRGGIPEAWCRKNAVKIIDYDCVEHKAGGAPKVDAQKTALILSALSGAGADKAPV